MSEKIAIYPGSFDPVTNGHMDIIERTAKIFDTLVVTVFENASKSPLFTLQERKDMLEQATEDLPNVIVDCHDGLLVSYAKKKGASAIVKGLRAVSDFENEMQMAQMNKSIANGVETLFMMTSAEHSYLSSSIIKELASYGAEIKHLVPEAAGDKLNEFYSR